MDTNPDLPPFDPELLTRVLTGHASVIERRIVEQWAAEHPRNATQWSSLQQVWNAAESQHGKTEDVEVLVQRVLGSIAAQERMPRISTAGARAARERRTSLGTRNLCVGLWIGTLAMTIGAVVLMTRRVGRPSPNIAHTYMTGVYQQGVVTLSDGTRVTLAPQTTLRELRFGASSRMVTLETGEAYFEVAQSSGAPFIVQSGAVTTRVLGTTFFVRHGTNDQHVRVAVIDGKVRVTTSARTDQGVTLTGGQVGDVTDSITHVSAVDDLAPGAERAPGRIMFRYTPLATVLQTVSQWYGLHFRYADQTLGTRTVSIMISTQSSAEALAAIERVLAVNLTVVGDTVTLVPQSPRASRTAPRIRTYDVWTPIREVGR